MIKKQYPVIKKEFVEKCILENRLFLLQQPVEQNI